MMCLLIRLSPDAAALWSTMFPDGLLGLRRHLRKGRQVDSLHHPNQTEKYQALKYRCSIQPAEGRADGRHNAGVSQHGGDGPESITVPSPWSRAFSLLRRVPAVAYIPPPLLLLLLFLFNFFHTWNVSGYFHRIRVQFNADQPANP